MAEKGKEIKVETLIQCPYCGTQNPSRNRFCKKCQKYLENEEERPEAEKSG